MFRKFLGTRTVVWLAVFVLTATTGEGQGMTPATFLERYKAESANLLSAYQHVHMISRVTASEPPKKPRTFRLEYSQDGNNYKSLQSQLEPADERAAINVANPDISFGARRGEGSQDYSLVNLPARRGVGYEGSREGVTLVCANLRAHYCFREIRLGDYINEPGTSIQKVEENFSAGKSSLRVWVRQESPDEVKKAGIEYSDGWFLVDQSAGWGVGGSEIVYRNKNKEVVSKVRSAVEYGKPIEGVPVPKRTRYETLNNKEEVVREQVAEIESVKFGAVPAKEFTLAGNGIQDIQAGSRGVRRVIYVCSGIALLAIIVIVVLRRGKPASPRLEDSK